VADELLAVGVGLAAGLAITYVARIWLAREELPEAAALPSGPDRGPAADREAGGRADEGR
jgi:hypothetical protein